VKYDVYIMQEFIDDVCGLSDLSDIVDEMINWIAMMVIGVHCLGEVMRRPSPPWNLILRHCSVDRQFILDNAHKLGEVVFLLSNLFSIDNEIFNALSDHGKFDICTMLSNCDTTADIRRLIRYVNARKDAYLKIDRSLSQNDIDYFVENINDGMSVQSLLTHNRLNVRQLKNLWKKMHVNAGRYRYAIVRTRLRYRIIIDILDFIIHVDALDIVSTMIDWDSIVGASKSWSLTLLYYSVDHSTIIKHINEFDNRALFTLRDYYDIDDEIFDSLSSEARIYIGNTYDARMHVDIRKCIPYLSCINKRLREDEIDVVIDNVTITGRILKSLLQQRLTVEQLQRIRRKISGTAKYVVDDVYRDVINWLDKNEVRY
jgi:hypothetical protein